MTFEELKKAYAELIEKAREVKVTEEQWDEIANMGALVQALQTVDE